MSGAADSHVWRQCQASGWAGTWPGAEGTLLTHRQRISALRMARYTATWTSTEEPPTAATAAYWMDQRPPWPPLRQIRALQRHHRWWRANLHVRKVRRGDLTHHIPPALAPPPASQRRLSLAEDLSYAQLITLTLTGPTWTRRRLRRRNVTVRPDPPQGPLAGLLWAHHGRGDLTWAPPPPPHERHVALRVVGVALLVLVVIAALGPILLMLFAGRSARRTL